MDVHGGEYGIVVHEQIEKSDDLINSWGNLFQPRRAQLFKGH